MNYSNMNMFSSGVVSAESSMKGNNQEIVYKRYALMKFPPKKHVIIYLYIN